MVKSRRGSAAVVIIVLALGILFRFAGLDRKIYWHDEAATSLWISGYNEHDMRAELEAAGPVPFAALGKYQHTNPGRPLGAVLGSVATHEPHEPLLYVAAVSIWARAVGESVAALRAFSAFVSLLTFPLMFWLTWELFRSRRTAWLATTLLAVSPFHVLYAQEARMYSLWTVSTLYSCAALLWALRTRRRVAWAAYSLSVVIGLYSHLLFALVVVAHGLYALARDDFRRGPAVPAFVWANLAAGVAVLPWFLSLIWHWPAAQVGLVWLHRNYGVVTWSKEFLWNVSTLWFDARMWDGAGYLGVVYVLLAAYALYVLPRIGSRDAYWFVYLLIGVTVVAFALPDLAFHERRLNIGRYGIPCWVALQLAVAHLLRVRLDDADAPRWHTRCWEGIAALVFLGGVLSYVVSSPQEMWWPKANSRHNRCVARVIDASARPLVLSRATFAVLSLSHVVTNPAAAFMMVPEDGPLRMPDGYSDIFVFQPDSIAEIMQRSNLSAGSAGEHGCLWRLHAPDGDGHGSTS